MAEKSTAFGRMTNGGETESAAAAERFVPNVVYTRDAKIDPSKMEIGRLRLAQGTTQEVQDDRAKIGQYVLTGFPAKDEVLLVPLGAQNTRWYQPDPKAPPKCAAPTGDVGYGDPGGDCSKCPLALWGARDPRTGKSAPPKCTEAISLRAYSLTHRTILDFRFDGRRVGKGALIQQQALAFGYGAFVVRMTSGRVENDKGKWAEPEIEILGDVPEDQAEIVSKWYEIHSRTLVSGDEAHAALASGA